MLADWSRELRPVRFLLGTTVLGFLASVWILAAGYPEVGPWSGQPVGLGDPWRRAFLVVCSGLLMARVLVSELLIHDRWRRWEAALTIAGGVLSYQLGLAVAGAGAREPLGHGVDLVATILVLLGIAVYGSTLARYLRRRGPRAGPPGLSTGQLPRLVRNPGLLGDLACGVGAALLSRNAAGLVVPVVHLLALVRLVIPERESRRRTRHPGRRRLGEARGGRLIPFVY